MLPSIVEAAGEPVELGAKPAMVVTAEIETALSVIPAAATGQCAGRQRTEPGGYLI